MEVLPTTKRTRPNKTPTWPCEVPSGKGSCLCGREPSKKCRLYCQRYPAGAPWLACLLLGALVPAAQAYASEYSGDIYSHWWHDAIEQQTMNPPTPMGMGPTQAAPVAGPEAFVRKASGIPLDPLLIEKYAHKLTVPGNMPGAADQVRRAAAPPPRTAAGASWPAGGAAVAPSRHPCQVHAF